MTIERPRFDDIVLEELQEGILLMTLNRPERLNALTFGMFDALNELQAAVAADPGVRVLIVGGAGRGFCSGLDLDDAERLAAMSPEEMLTRQEGWARAVAGFRLLPTPVIAAVNGPAAGAGFGLALAADIRIASSAASFSAAFLRIGLTGGDVGVSWVLPRIVGLGHASDILLSGRTIDAQRAREIGLVTEVTPPDTLLAAAVERAAAIAAFAPLGVRLTKQVLQTNVDAPSIEAALELENRNQVLATRTADMPEALAAFRDKRPPRFGGR